MTGFIEAVSACVIVGFWGLAVLTATLAVMGFYRRFIFKMEEAKRDDIARTLGWDDYETMHKYIQRSLSKYHRSQPDAPLAVESARQKGLETGATIAVKVVMRALMAEINGAAADRRRLERKALLLQHKALKGLLRRASE